LLITVASELDQQESYCSLCIQLPPAYPIVYTGLPIPGEQVSRILVSLYSIQKDNTTLQKKSGGQWPLVHHLVIQD